MNEGSGAKVPDTGIDCYPHPLYLATSQVEQRAKKADPGLTHLTYFTSWEPRRERSEVELVLGPCGGKDLALGPSSLRSLHL